jgi:hypothetical protein
MLIVQHGEVIVTFPHLHITHFGHIYFLYYSLCFLLLDISLSPPAPEEPPSHLSTLKPSLRIGTCPRFGTLGKKEASGHQEQVETSALGTSAELILKAHFSFPTLQRRE